MHADPYNVLLQQSYLGCNSPTLVLLSGIAFAKMIRAPFMRFFLYSNIACHFALMFHRTSIDPCAVHCTPTRHALAGCIQISVSGSRSSRKDGIATIVVDTSSYVRYNRCNTIVILNNKYRRNFLCSIPDNKCLFSTAESYVSYTAGFQRYWLLVSGV